MTQFYASFSSLKKIKELLPSSSYKEICMFTASEFQVCFRPCDRTENVIDPSFFKKNEHRELLAHKDFQEVQFSPERCFEVDAECLEKDRIHVFIPLGNRPFSTHTLAVCHFVHLPFLLEEENSDLCHVQCVVQNGINILHTRIRQAIFHIFVHIALLHDLEVIQNSSADVWRKSQGTITHIFPKADHIRIIKGNPIHLSKDMFHQIVNRY